MGKFVPDPEMERLVHEMNQMMEAVIESVSRLKELESAIVSRKKKLEKITQRKQALVQQSLSVSLRRIMIRGLIVRLGLS